MAQLPGWMPILLDRISWGCSTSPLFVNLADENKLLETGKTSCSELWPFIKELPNNIAYVRDKAPESNVAAKNLLGQLADDERHYQQLFIKQCHLAGLTDEELATLNPNQATQDFCNAMNSMCQKSDFVNGVHAIVAAEFAATLFSRSALPSYETYFLKRASEYPPGRIEEGLAWLRLHAKTHTRHAIWMIRMLEDIEDSSGNEIPDAAELMLNCVFKLWQCPPEETRTPAALSR
jgi:pyrroloquinoline quinone (PQQ) biosynthesis protein C